MGKKTGPGYKNKTNKYADLNEPQAEFDFHDLGILSTAEIQKMATNFLQESKKSGLQKVLIITGKGLHSKDNEAVVKPVLLEYLPTLSFVSSVRLARRDRGGDGALEVVLGN